MGPFDLPYQKTQTLALVAKHGRDCSAAQPAGHMAGSMVTKMGAPKESTSQQRVQPPKSPRATISSFKIQKRCFRRALNSVSPHEATHSLKELPGSWGCVKQALTLTGKTHLYPSYLFLIFINRENIKSQFLLQDRKVDSDKKVIFLCGDSTTLWFQETLHNGLAQSSTHRAPFQKPEDTGLNLCEALNSVTMPNNEGPLCRQATSLFWHYSRISQPVKDSRGNDYIYFNISLPSQSIH